jgi:hypothetical protein
VSAGRWLSRDIAITVVCTARRDGFQDLQPCHEGVMRPVAALLVALSTAACAAHSVCNGFCGGNETSFTFSCVPTGPVRVEVGGPCAQVGVTTNAGFDVSSATPGVCHLVATFASGYTYSGDVTFRASECCGPAPTEFNLAIDLPVNECLPEGGSFGGWDASLPRDGGPDARGDGD